MARSRGDTPTRAEVTEAVDSHREEMDQQAEEIEAKVQDLEVERRTLDELERGGTADGAEEADRNIEQAQDVSSQEFETETEVLEQKHDETEEYEAELDDREAVATSDRERISEGQAEVTSDASKNELAEAEAAAEQDIEFLDESEQAAREAREESQRLRDEYQNRAASARS